MANRMVEIVAHKKCGTIAVLETPMFPCAYYGGRVLVRGPQWIPATNETRHFFREFRDAYNHAKQISQEYADA